MPYLDHDPQNPTDLLGRPIAVGDVVAWGTTWGRSPALAVCVIEKIRFIAKENGESWGKNIEVDQWLATDYQLMLRPIKSTGDMGYVMPNGDHYYEHKHGPDPEAVGAKAKTKNVQLVKNVVKLEPMA
jgi:hypothetical protein